MVNKTTGLLPDRFLELLDLLVRADNDHDVVRRQNVLRYRGDNDSFRLIDRHDAATEPSPWIHVVERLPR